MNRDRGIAPQAQADIRFRKTRRCDKSQFGRSADYVKAAHRNPFRSFAMMRTLFLVVSAVGCVLAADAHAQMSEADLVTRLGRMEATIRELTGRVEQLQYRNQQLEQQLQRLQQEEAARGEGGAGRPAAPPVRSSGQYSPQTYSQSPASPPVVSSQVAPPIEVPPPGGRARGDAFDPSANPNAPGAPRALGASTAANEPPPPVSDGPRQIGAPLDLSTPGGRPGELPPPPPTNPNATGGMQQATLPPSNSPRDQYDLAYGYVLRKDYAQAAETFRGFLRQYPSDHLAPEAQYWLGESLFQQQQYRDAAESFLAVSTKYEATARAPEALLRLGQSLAALGEKEAACASLGEVLRKYPHATPAVKQAVDREQKRGRC
jgi:tol-pal system protein YbgF